MDDEKPVTIPSLGTRQFGVTKPSALIDSTIETLQPKFMQDNEIVDLTSRYSDLWDHLSDAPAPIGRTYTLQQQRDNELRIESILFEADRETRTRSGVEKHIGKLRDSIRDLVLDSVDSEKRGQIAEMLTAFSNAGDEFVRRSKEFDDNLRFENIFQSLRNLWIINSMQEAFDLPICVNPSGLAYSLLYTYTDNYLDAADVTQLEKVKFGQSFGRRLAGFEVLDESSRFSKISELVRLIESEYPRSSFPGVYASLLAINHAQEKSLQQRLIAGNIIQTDILGISVEKGGTSVVADAYVTKGRLTPVEMNFAFGYGVFLQFIDDLQDVKEDLRERSETLFTCAAREGTLDSITNRLIQYLREILFAASSLSSPRANALAELILQGSLGLILESIALNPELFSTEYVKTAELFSPLGFESIQRLHSKRSSLELNLNPGARNIGPENLKQMTLTKSRSSDKEFVKQY